MDITIHRGTQEIGGSCVQITSQGKSILVDAGSPLGESASDVNLDNVQFDEIFISHPHKDHYGLIENHDPSTPIYIGQIARELIDATRIFLGNKPLKNTFKYFKNREWVELGPNFRIMPYLMDHSCVDAYGFLIEAEGKCVYYSGDFRAHGRKGKLFKWILADPPKNIDILLMEGTMMRRNNVKSPDEDAVQSKMIEMLNTHASEPCFLICSGQHIDRLCAALKAGITAKRTLVLDIYTAYVLRVVSTHLPNVPDITTTDKIKVLTRGITAGSHYSKVAENRSHFGRFASDLFASNTAIDFDEVVKNGHKYFIKVSNFSDLLDAVDSCAVIYSMWSGYLKEDRYQRIQNNSKVSFYEIHTSGHAIKDDLQRLATAINPKMLIPIHTEFGGDYVGLTKRVEPLKDGQLFQI